MAALVLGLIAGVIFVVGLVLPIRFQGLAIGLILLGAVLMFVAIDTALETLVPR